MANLSQWVDGISAPEVVAAFGEAMKAAGLAVLYGDEAVGPSEA